VRTCKHLQALRGAATERDRVAAGMSTRAVVMAAQADAQAAAAADGDGNGISGPDGGFGFMLAQEWDACADLAGWLLSEKLDGVRALWTGSALLSRGGTRLLAPPSWTAGLPAGVPLDGELWAGRGRFDEASSTARSAAAGDAAWARITFMVFDAPQADGAFEARLAAAEAALGHARAARIVAHAPARDNAEVAARLQEVIDAGGEGLMVRLMLPIAACMCSDSRCAGTCARVRVRLGARARAAEGEARVGRRGARGGAHARQGPPRGARRHRCAAVRAQKRRHVRAPPCVLRALRRVARCARA
jgi:hypothetical protein